MDKHEILEDISFEVEYGAEKNLEFKNSDGWTCTIGYDGKYIEIPFYMGKGHEGREPEMLEVLECLVSDATSSSMSFEEWCAEFGYNNDSIKDLKSYNECVKIGEKLHYLFGDDHEQITDAIYEMVE